MEIFNFDVESLSAETLNLKHDLLGKNPFYDNIDDAHEEQKSDSLDCPGVIYQINFGTNTFSIKGLACSNLQAELNSLEEKSNPIFKEELDLEFFVTDSLEIAEVIVDQLTKRRFPYMEDMLCNLSDPGFSWWVSVGQNELVIHYKSYGIDRSSNLICLGPVGDSRIASKRFKQLFYEERINKEVLIESDEKCFRVKSLCLSLPKMDILKDALVDGYYLPLENSNSSSERTLCFYMQELVAVRNFWLEIEERISDRIPQFLK